MSKKDILYRYYGDKSVDPEQQVRYSKSPQRYNMEGSSIKHFSSRTSERYGTPRRKFDLQNEYKLNSHQSTPNVRSFLRHTTYLNKGSSFLDIQKPNLTSSGVKKYSNGPSDYSSFQHLSSLSAVSEPTFKSYLNVYGDQKYDKIASKVQRTTNSIEQLKKYHQEHTKAGKTDTSQKSDTFQTLPTFRTDQQERYFNFKKKDSRNDYYTPKVETSFLANQKLKRIYSPEVQILKVLSPSYKKTHQAMTIKDFILGPKLGGGKFGVVSRVYHIKTKSIYALKKIPKSTLKQHMMVDQFILEVKLQSFLNHQNILQIYGVFDDKDHLYMILEYMTDGTLYQLLKKKKTLSEKETAPKIKQLASALVFMHEQGIVHRDIKPENIVLSGDICKLCDFGWATVCNDRRKTYCGTFDYAAPEIIEGIQYDMTVDLWCLGVLTYELMVGKSPFYHINRKQTIHNILNVQSRKIRYPSTMSHSAKSFIGCLLRKKPEERLSCDEILKHPFLVNIEAEL